jgi:hypothetical protein
LKIASVIKDTFREKNAMVTVKVNGSPAERRKEIVNLKNKIMISKCQMEK